MGIMVLRSASSGACRETERVTFNFSLANSSILSASPQVETEIFRIPIFRPSGLLINLRNFTRLSKFSNGSPLPITTQ